MFWRAPGYGFNNRRKRGLPAITPVYAPAPIPLNSLANRAALASPSSQFTDAVSTDNPTGAGTVLRWSSGLTSADIWATPAALLPAGVDVRNGTIMIPYKPISNYERPLRFAMELHSGATSANFHQMKDSEGPSSLKASTAQANDGGPGRWSNLGVPISDFGQISGTGADLSSIRQFRLKLRGNSSYNTVLEFGTPYFQPNQLPKAKAFFVVDDGYDSYYTTLLPIFMQYPDFRFAFNMGAMDLTLNQPGRLSSAQISALIAAGCQAMLQAKPDETLATYAAMTEAERDASQQYQKNLLMSLGASAIDVGFQSYFSSVTEKQLAIFGMFQRNGRGTRTFDTARSVGAPDYPLLYGLPYPFPDKHLIRSLPLEGGTTLEQAKQHAEQAILNSGVASYSSHASFGLYSDLLAWYNLPEQRARIDVVLERDLFIQYPY